MDKIDDVGVNIGVSELGHEKDHLDSNDLFSSIERDSLNETWDRGNQKDIKYIFILFFISEFLANICFFFSPSQVYTVKRFQN